MMTGTVRAICALAVLALAAALLWTPASAAPATSTNNLGLKTIPFRIVNNTGRGGNLFLYVIGQVPSQGSKWFYLSNVNGDLTIVPQIPVPGKSLALKLGTDRRYDVMLPQIEAARIFFSLGDPVVVYADAVGAAPSAPNGWATGDPNFNTLFDWAEFTWHPEADPRFTTTLGINATQVDMFGFAMLIQVTGTNDAEQVGAVKKAGFSDTGARAKIFADISAKQPWNKLIVNRGGTLLRAIAPYHGIEMSVFPSDFLDNYIDKVWGYYTAFTLTGMAENRTYRGMVNMSTQRLVFTQDGADPDPSRSFKKPTTKEAYENFMPPIECGPKDTTGPCNRARVLGAFMGAGFMRTTILKNNNLNACVVTDFYQDGPVNMYAQAFHKYSVQHRAYSFGFDDTCEQSSFIQIHDPTNLKITLQPFN